MAKNIRQRMQFSQFEIPAYLSPHLQLLAGEAAAAKNLEEFLIPDYWIDGFLNFDENDDEG